MKKVSMYFNMRLVGVHSKIKEPSNTLFALNEQFAKRPYSMIPYYNLDPVVQSIVSLTISLRHEFVKQISAKVTYTLLYFVEKM